MRYSCTPITSTSVITDCAKVHRPRTALGEATAHGMTLSHGRSPKTGAVTANGRPPKNADCENYLGLSQSFFGGQIGLNISKPPSFFWKISMVDIDEILAAAIRTAWLEFSGPESRSPHHIEVQTARRVRHALEREGIIITRSRPACGHGQLYALQNAGHLSHPEE